MVLIYIINYLINVFKIHLQSRHLNAVIALITITLAAVVVGTRPLDAGFDTKGYVAAYNLLDKNLFQSLLLIREYFGVAIEPFFWGYAWLLSKSGLSDEAFLFVTAFLSIFLTYLAYRKLDCNYHYLSFIGVIFSGSFINLYGNAIRQGLAIPFFLMAFYHFQRGNHGKVFLLAVITFLCHQFTGMLIVLFYAIQFVPFKFYPIIWLGCLFTSFVLMTGVLSFVPGLAPYIKGGSFAYLIHPTYLEFPIYYFFIMKFELLEDKYFEKLFQFVAVVFLLQTLFIFNIYSYNRAGLLRFILEPIIYTRILLQIKPVKASRQIALFAFFVYGLAIYLSEIVQKTLSSTSVK